MHAIRFSLLAAAALIAAVSAPAQTAQTPAPPQDALAAPQHPTDQAPKLKLIRGPMVPYPDEALLKNVEGKVTLRLVVDAKGKVIDAKAVTGPPELFQAALDSVKLWEFEPPAHAPVETDAEVIYSHPHECPGPISEAGEVSGSGRLVGAKGTIVGETDENWPLPPYFDEDRKAGVAGEMVLAVTIGPGGDVTNVRVVKSLSAHLDNGAIETARAMKFIVRPGSPGGLPDEFSMRFTFRATCMPNY
jgi:TonB family protein